MQNRRLFIDTNIILDLLDDKRKYHLDSKKLIQKCLSEDIVVAISDDIITTVYYLSQKQVKRDKLLSFIKFLNNNFEILTFDYEVIEESINICLEHINFDFKDTLQAICAKKYKFYTLVTNDKKFPKVDGIHIINSPF